MTATITRALDKLEEGLVAILLAIMTVTAFAQVIARYVFNFSFTWALELVTFLFAGLIFIGISYGIRIGAHIGVDAAVKVMPANLRRIVGALAVVLCMSYCAIIFIGSWTYVSKMYAIGIMAQDIPIPQWVPRAVLPIGFALAFFRFGEILVRILKGTDGGLQLADEAKDALEMRQDKEETGR
jgi:C4-dicarboxylate transporter DctQ subunit